MLKHGHFTRSNQSPTYSSWWAMIQRCRNPRSTAYPRYGGKGITYCPQWADFMVFAKDMGERPPGTTLDRIDGRGNYEPGNCRWATRSEQNLNRDYVPPLRLKIGTVVNGWVCLGMVRRDDHSGSVYLWDTPNGRVECRKRMAGSTWHLNRATTKKTC